MKTDRQYFDVILPVAPKDMENMEICIRKIMENIHPQKIIVIASNQVRSMIPLLDGVEFCDEDHLKENLTLYDVEQTMVEITGSKARSNWYFQQFLKMAYAFRCSHDYYLIWDSDTIPLNDIQFWENINGKEKCLFSTRPRCRAYYINTLNTLFNGKVKKLTKRSFIVEHMMINRKIMKELIHEIEMNDQIQGKYFFEKILHAIDKNDIQFSGFSEFETYGNYVLNFYPEMYAVRNLRTYRKGAMVIDKSQVDNNTLDWISKNYDTISFEGHDYKRIFCFLRRKMAVYKQRRCISFKTYQFILRILGKMGSLFRIAVFMLIP